MSQLLPSGWENWIPLIAAVWLASILVLIISARRYFASRALDREEGGPTPMQEPFIEAGRTPGMLIGAESVFTAARTRIARDRVSAQGLSELIRALYLDETNFTFQTIAELDAEDRGLAKRLIEEWLADPSACEIWEEIYDIAREPRRQSQSEPA